MKVSTQQCPRVSSFRSNREHRVKVHGPLPQTQPRMPARVFACFCVHRRVHGWATLRPPPDTYLLLMFLKASKGTGPNGARGQLVNIQMGSSGSPLRTHTSLTPLTKPPHPLGVPTTLDFYVRSLQDPQQRHDERGALSPR